MREWNPYNKEENMKKFTPNFRDPRTIRRVNSALNFVANTFKIKRTQIHLGRDLLDQPENFGKSSNPLSAYLRDVLLICTDPSYRFNSDFNKSKRYALNTLGVNYLTERLANTTDISWSEYREQHSADTQCQLLDSIQEKQADQLIEQYDAEIQSGKFVMRQIGHREYHALQNIPRDLRAVKLAQSGYCHDYDIETAAPSLLLQRARMLGMTEPTPTIDYFLTNKVMVRNAIAEDCGIDYQQAKQVITALFQGAVLSCFAENRIFSETINYNRLAMQALQTNELIIALKEEIRIMWATIATTIDRETFVDSRGVTRRRRITGRQKAQTYVEIEQLIMKQIKRFISRYHPNTRIITEHDGWRTDRIIDIDAVKTHVRRRTGYVINIEYTSYAE